MKIIQNNFLTDEQKDAIMQLWNKEYPVQLILNTMNDLEEYLKQLNNQVHYFTLDNDKKITGWATLFDRSNERWFAMILDSSVQRKGYGSLLLSTFKENEIFLNGWVIDHNSYIKHNGDIYNSPLSFYLKNNFIVCDERLETGFLSAVKIQWMHKA